MEKGKHQRTDDSICILVIDTCFSLKKSLRSLKIQMWFYYHKIINFVTLLWNKFRIIVNKKYDYKL